jgi:hypothetical protein
MTLAMPSSFHSEVGWSFLRRWKVGVERESVVDRSLRNGIVNGHLAMRSRRVNSGEGSIEVEKESVDDQKENGKNDAFEGHV